MRILISGGAGFIGLHLARQLQADHELEALDLLHPQVHLDAEASRRSFPGPVVLGDVSDEDVWAGLQSPDLVIHLAAETGTGQSMYEQERYRRVNVEGTRAAGVAAREWGVPLIAMSSRAVYGNGRSECPTHGTRFGEPCCQEAAPAASTEDDPHTPVSFYGETKSEGEQVLSDTAAAVPVTIIRPQNVIGPGQALHNPYTGVLAAFLARLREGRSLVVYGDGSATRDFIHVEDLARLIDWCARHPAHPGSALVLNAGSGVRTTLDELAEAAAAGSGRADVPIEHVDVHRAGDIEHACADLSRLVELGAPMAQWSTRDAIIDFVRRSWDKPGAASSAWDQALVELDERGLTR
ncbi:NAD-dependent epimerase/dehydratase family protein [Pedococcus sp. P5_B7]